VSPPARRPPPPPIGPTTDADELKVVQRAAVDAGATVERTRRGYVLRTAGRIVHVTALDAIEGALRASAP
jgi:hypothetical protein